MSTQTVSELRLRMAEDMKARQLGVHTQRSHIYSCKRFGASPPPHRPRRPARETLPSRA
jgi:hypothetical protein